MSSLESKLDGFEFIESDFLPFISLDKQGRFHVNKNARRLLDVEAGDTVVIAYKASTQELAVLPNDDAYELAGASYATYEIDKRYYMSAKALAKEFGIYGEHQVFYYDRSTKDGALYIFKRRK